MCWLIRGELADLQMITEYAVDLRQLIVESSIEEQKARFIKEIRVKGGDVELISLLSGDSRKVEVLDIERTGSAHWNFTNFSLRISPWFRLYSNSS